MGPYRVFCTVQNECRIDRDNKGGAMQQYTYLSMIPESLVISMLPPEQFGTYLATGTRKRAKEEAVFFDVDPDQLKDFDLGPAFERCTPHPNGEPKHSVYVSIYRVLERVPMSALRSLWLTTPDGRVLELTAAPELPTRFPAPLHLMQELAPVHPLIATELDPIAFTQFITAQDKPVSVPAICFATLDLGRLADDPENGQAADLPYRSIGHLRDCLKELRDTKKRAKTVDRIHSQHIPFRCIKGGFYVGSGSEIKHYPFPSPEELDTHHHEWWRSASLC